MTAAVWVLAAESDLAMAWVQAAEWHRICTAPRPLGLFNSDGSLNQSAVDEFKTHLSEDPEDAAFLSQMLSRAVTAGAITQAQADKLVAALGINKASTATPAPTASASKAATTA
jgi:hypothetical protein